MTYRLFRVLFRVVASVLRFHAEVSGLEALPRTSDGRLAGGWIAAGLPHRIWIDPFLLWLVLPVEPRLVFFGDARTMARSPLRRWVVRRIGGILPIPSHGGPKAFATHIAAAGEVLRAGAVFCLFPEYGGPAPVGESRPIAAGLGYIALRTGAPIVPIVIGGNHELFLGRRIVVQVLAPIDPRALAGIPVDSAAPDAPASASALNPGSRDERAAAHALAEGFRASTAAAVAAAHLAAEPPAGTRKRGLRMTTLFR